MRVRKKPWAESELKDNPMVIGEPQEKKGIWKEVFGSESPIYIEIGCGKGRFIEALANRYPELSFIGIERQKSVLATVTRRLREKPVKNLRFISADAAGIEELFAPGEVSRIYINFCDPWPRKKWGKRRLTHRGFLEKYKKLFPGKGELFFKTDNRGLFEFSLEELKVCGFELADETFDLYAGDTSENIATEYEEKFASEGVPICRVNAFWQN